MSHGKDMEIDCQLGPRERERLMRWKQRSWFFWNENSAIAFFLRSLRNSGQCPVAVDQWLLFPKSLRGLVFPTLPGSASRCSCACSRQNVRIAQNMRDAEALACTLRRLAPPHAPLRTSGTRPASSWSRTSKCMRCHGSVRSSRSTCS